MENIIKEISAKAEADKNNYQDLDFDELFQHARDRMCAAEDEGFGPAFREQLLELSTLFALWIHDVDTENANDPDVLREQIAKVREERDLARGQVEALRTLANQLEAARDRLQEQLNENQPPNPPSFLIKENPGWIFSKDEILIDLLCK